jgi:endoglucanase
MTFATRVWPKRGVRLAAAAAFVVLALGAAASEEGAAGRANRALGRGINLGNALDAPLDAAWALRLRGDYFDAIKQAGFDSVRLPVAFYLHTAAEAPYTIEPGFMARVDWAINQALSRGLVVVLDNHHDVGMEKRPDDSLPRLVAVWAQLAEHFHDYPEALYFELLNEPSDALTDGEWAKDAPAVLSAVRKVDPKRTVVIGPAYWNSLDHLGALALPEDDRNIIVTFHYYVPLRFTHQGAGWMPGADKWKGTTWTGDAAEQATLDHDFDKAAAWATANRRPLYLGEFGAFQAADMESRARWTRAVADAARRRGMSFAYWEFGSSFGAYDPTKLQWRAPLLEALTDQGGAVKP